MTYEVLHLLPELEFNQFRDPDNHESWNEVWKLAQEQVRDDSPGTKGETHWNRTRWNAVRDIGLEYGDDHELWPTLTDRQRAMEYGLDPVLDLVLTAEQRVL